MLKKSSSTIIVAVFTAALLILFAFNQRSPHPLLWPASNFYLAAAIICLAPGAYASICRKCRNGKTAK